MVVVASLMAVLFANQVFAGRKGKAKVSLEEVEKYHQSLRMRPRPCKADADCLKKPLPRLTHEEHYCASVNGSATVKQCQPKGHAQKCSPGYVREQGNLRLGRCIQPTLLLKAYYNEWERRIIADSYGRKMHKKYRWATIKKNLYFYIACGLFVFLLVLAGKAKNGVIKITR